MEKFIELLQTLQNEKVLKLIHTEDLDDESYEDVYEVQNENDQKIMTIRVYRAK